jgi:ABC-type Fe3+/spermidine/putrescine transport system ATPase subunit
MIAGFEIPDGGRIRLGDRDVTVLAPEHRNIGMVFQNYALFPHLTVAQNVAFGLEMRSVARAEIRRRVDAILDRVRLVGYGGRFPRQLSGGQQQRAALARALVINPSVLLLDEPLANLDAKLREEMRFYIRGLQREFGITTVYVTHDQAEAMVLADRIAVMKEGVAQQVAPPDDVYRRPANAWVAQFVGLTNFVPGDVAGASDGALVVRTAAGEIRCARGATAASGAIWLCIRPEALHFGHDRANRMAGVVRERVYLGNLYDYRVEVAPRLVLRVQADPSQTHAPGARVPLSFDTQEAWPVARGEDAAP